MYGGSFNPPTKAHQTIIETIKQLFPRDQLLIVPVGNHYHKQSLIGYHHRKHMLQLMDPSLEVLDIEQKVPFLGTIHTLKTIKEMTKQQVGFVVGSDQLKDIESWIEYKTLIKTYPMLIITRPNYDLSLYVKKLHDLHATYQIIHMHLDISSTQFRRIKDEKLLHPDVFKYIKKHQLFEE